MSLHIVEAMRHLCKEHRCCGCEASACCLVCLLPYCRYEDATAIVALRRMHRRERLQELRRRGLGPIAISRELGVNRNTVYNDIKALEVK